jgi:uncharacterized Zn finger protein
MRLHKYYCKNCGAGQDRKHVEAMRKAGFSPRHLECRECGQQAVTRREP